jgi:hypothetical protein
MKFVHLTPQPNIGRIKRNGIHLGGGRRGRGVYAVPLMLMEQRMSLDDDRQLHTVPRPLTTLWQWLSEYASRHRNLAAVIFEDSKQHWPLALHMQLHRDIGYDWLLDMPLACAPANAEAMVDVREARAKGYCLDLKLSVADAKTLGTVMHQLQSRDYRPLAKYDDDFELVLPAGVPSRSIERIVPLYRTNKRFVREREQHRGRIDARDSDQGL